MLRGFVAVPGWTDIRYIYVSLISPSGLQRLDTSEARITARYQHALTKMKFAAHSEEFLGRAGVRKVHRSTVQYVSLT